MRPRDVAARVGPWKESVYLIGGLTPRYPVAARLPMVPAHAGTLDVDIVIDLQILADTEAYHTLEDNHQEDGFRVRRERQAAKAFLAMANPHRTRCADGVGAAGGKVQPLPTEGTISAINILHSSIVFDLHEAAEIEAELLGSDGIAVEKIKHTNLVSFTCLKAFAFNQRFERKDAHDLIYAWSMRLKALMPLLRYSSRNMKASMVIS